MPGRNATITQVTKCLKRLAFGDHDDFAVSELKAHRDGGQDVVYYDRYKAMQMLLDIVRQETSREDTIGLYAALEATTRALNEQEEVDVYDE